MTAENPRPNPVRELLGNGPFRSFWLANLLSNLGTSAFVMAITWLTVKDYGAAGIAALALGYGIPQFLLQLLGGSASDRINRRTLFLITESCFLVVALTLLVSSLTMMPPLWLLVAVNACNGAISAFDTPARTSLISEMVAAEQVVSAQQFYSLSANLTNVFGPALGGILLSLGTDDHSHEEFAFLFNVLSFVPLLACVPFLPKARPKESSGPKPGFVASVSEGLTYVRDHLNLRSLLGLLALVMLLGMPFQTLLPIFVHSHLSMETGHGFYAALLSAVGLGAFMGSLLGMGIGELRQPGPALAAAGGGLALAVLILSSSNVLHWASLAAFFAGGCGTLAINLDNALLQGLTPVVMQGRLSSIANLTKGLQAFSASGASWLIHVLSHSANATTSGYLEVQLSLALLLLVGVGLLWPRLRHLQTVPA